MSSNTLGIIDLMLVGSFSTIRSFSSTQHLKYKVKAESQITPTNKQANKLAAVATFRL